MMNVCHVLLNLLLRIFLLSDYVFPYLKPYNYCHLPCHQAYPYCENMILPCDDLHEPEIKQLAQYNHCYQGVCHVGGKLAAGRLKFLEVDEQLVIFVKPEAEEEE